MAACLHASDPLRRNPEPAGAEAGSEAVCAPRGHTTRYVMPAGHAHDRAYITRCARAGLIC